MNDVEILLLNLAKGKRTEGNASALWNGRNGDWRWPGWLVTHGVRV